MTGTKAEPLATHFKCKHSWVTMLKPLKVIFNAEVKEGINAI